MDRKENFSYEGLRLLFDYLEEVEADSGVEIELDVIALCCDFTEFQSLQAVAEEYGITGDDDEIRDWLSYRTDFLEREIKNYDGASKHVVIVQNH
jgi:hypothetical protein